MARVRKIRMLIELEIFFRYEDNFTFFFISETSELIRIHCIRINLTRDDTFLRFVKSTIATHRLELLVNDLLCFTDSIVFTPQRSE